MSLIALLAAHAAALIPVAATGPTWSDNPTAGGGTWTTPTQEGITYSPASGTATSGQSVTVTATAQSGYTLQGTSSWSHTFPVAPAVPYEFPTTAPYNVPVPMVTALGEVVHPSVVDFQVQHSLSTWNGYRYWMGITPYPNGNSGAENPCIQVSHDGYTWVTPPGLTNPIDPPPGASGYNSDTELAYDPSTGRLWCMWREHRHSAPPVGYHLHIAWTTNGTTWTKIDDVLYHAVDGLTSPAIARVGVNDWRMLTVNQWWTATSPAGPWTLVGAATYNWGGGGTFSPWHFGMARIGGVYYGLVDMNGQPDQNVYACTSTTGLTWSVSTTPVVAVQAQPAWDHRPYRACLTPHENGTHARVWYSASNSQSPPYAWYAGFTQVPLTAWPAPPA